ncbi:MAG TPA: amidase family protein, partial [bacterium]|nr:amidase family protein [bacterium]
ARRLRGEPVGRLAGLPMTIKDQFIVDGTPTSLGLAHRSKEPLYGEGPLVRRLRGSDAVFLGKTNLPQLLVSYECRHALYGPANNPWDPGRAPGGSSGGEAAIVAAGGSPLGLGADMGGSLRIPAHCCGVYALKPTEHRFPNDDTPLDRGFFGGLAGFEGFVQQPGPLARSVDDLKLLMDVLLEKPLPGIAPVPWDSGPLHDDIKTLTVGFFTDNGLFPASPAIRTAVEEAARALEGRGARVIPFTPLDPVKGIALYLSLISADGARWMVDALVGEAPIGGIGNFIRSARMPGAMRGAMRLLLRSLGQTSADFLMAHVRAADTADHWRRCAERSRYRAEFRAAMENEKIDILLCPPFGLPAVPHDASYKGAGVFAASYAMLFNLLGMPAGVAPVARIPDGGESDRIAGRDGVARDAIAIENGSAGLPVGVQVVGRHWREDQVLTVMKVLAEVLRFHGDIGASA